MMKSPPMPLSLEGCNSTKHHPMHLENPIKEYFSDGVCKKSGCSQTLENGLLKTRIHKASMPVCVDFLWLQGPYFHRKDYYGLFCETFCWLKAPALCIRGTGGTTWYRTRSIIQVDGAPCDKATT
jgi:hypothetical protein